MLCIWIWFFISFALLSLIVTGKGIHLVHSVSNKLAHLIPLGVNLVKVGGAKRGFGVYCIISVFACMHLASITSAAASGLLRLRNLFNQNRSTNSQSRIIAIHKTH